MGNKESTPYSTGEVPHHAGSTAGSVHIPSMFADVYDSLPALQADLRRAGLESSNLIVGIDFTKSNEWTGKVSFGGRCLHDVSPATLNPYESSIMIIGETLSVFDDDNLIPAYGFGSAATNDRAVFSLLPRDTPCVGFTGVLESYRRVLPNVKLAGPTSFAPIIRKAANIVQASGNQYHILLIICDGQVTRSSDLPQSELSTQERDTIQAIIEASEVPLSIICVGVGDGEDGWKRMKEFDDLIPSRRFDNFQFVPLNETLELARRKVRASTHAALKTGMESTFALQALMEIPQQYRAILALGLMSSRPRVPIPLVAVLDPPVLPPASSRALPVEAPHADVAQSTPPVVPSTWACPQCTMIQPAGDSTCVMCGYGSKTSMQPSLPLQPSSAAAPRAATSSSAEAQLTALREEKLCSICLAQNKDTAFQCGHLTCSECASRISDCPMCRTKILTRIKVFT